MKHEEGGKRRCESRIHPHFAGTSKHLLERGSRGFVLHKAQIPADGERVCGILMVVEPRHALMVRRSVRIRDVEAKSAIDWVGRNGVRRMMFQNRDDQAFCSVSVA